MATTANLTDAVRVLADSLPDHGAASREAKAKVYDLLGVEDDPTPGGDPADDKAGGDDTPDDGD